MPRRRRRTWRRGRPRPTRPTPPRISTGSCASATTLRNPKAPRTAHRMTSSAAETERRDKLLGKIRLAAIWLVGLALVALACVARPDPVGWGVGLVIAG